MSGKKTKKSKGTTLSLQEFNQRMEDSKVSAGQNIVYAPKKPMSSWADEVDDDDSFMYTGGVEKIVLPSAPRAARGPAYDDSEIPREPPFIAHIGNLAYDIGEDDIYKFFRDLEIIELRLPRDSQNNNRLRGFGYVEFETRQDLINALIQNEQMLKGRQVRVNLGTNQQNRGDNDRRGDRGGYTPQDSTPDDWRSEPKTEFQGVPPPMGSMERLGGRDEGPRERRSYGMDRPPRPDNRYRDRESRPDFDRGGYRGGGGGSFDEEGGEDWRRGPREEFQRPPREDFQRPPREDFQRAPREDFQRPPRDDFQRPPRDDFQRPSRDDFQRPPPSFDRRPPSEEREHRERPSPRSESPHVPEAPRERPKLKLAPRTVPVPPGTSAPEANAAIFGGAKPVDTAAREREIEEKLAQMAVESREPTPPPQRERERERRVTSSSRDSQRDRSREEPQYRILQRPSSERTLSGGDPADLMSPTSDFEPSTRPMPGGRRFQTSPRSEEKPPPRIIQLRSGENRERLVSTSSLSSRGSNPDASSQPFSTSQQIVNGQQRGPRYPVPPAPGASNRHKSDSDDGDRDDDRSSRHEHQREVPAAPVTNPWNRRHVEHDNYRSRESVGPSDRKTPDSDRNGEKEKDSHSEPEDDRDSHPYVAEKGYAHDQDDDYRRVERRDYRDREPDRDRGDRQSDRGGDSYNRRSDRGSWQQGPRRSDMGGPRRGAFHEDSRRGGGRDDRDRFRDDRRDDRDRGFRDDRRDDFRDRRSNVDNRDRDYRGGMSRGMDRGGYERRGQGQGPRRGAGGPPPPMDKGPRRMNHRGDDFYRDSDGFENIRGTGRERPLPKHSEEKAPVVTSVNKFQTLGDEQCD